MVLKKAITSTFEHLKGVFWDDKRKIFFFISRAYEEGDIFEVVDQLKNKPNTKEENICCVKTNTKHTHLYQMPFLHIQFDTHGPRGRTV